MVLDEGIILELVQPGTGEPVAPGEVGEVVVTTLTPGISADPLCHRRSVGDAAGPEPAAAAPTSASRAGSAAPTRPTKVRGMFVHPEQIAEIVPPPPIDHPRPPRGRAAAERRRDDAAGRDRRAREDGGAIAETVQAVTKLRGTVSRVPPGSLPERRQAHRGPPADRIIRIIHQIVTLSSNRSPNSGRIWYA